tara:strand:+ start:679 stop:873 length:195 start_codon:yes stop_codon:yes gene_type:complete
MAIKQKMDPGSYAVIKWNALESEMLCKILGYRKGMMLIRSPNGDERAINPRSVQVVGLKEIANE